jgi:hypothetical protein
MATESALSTETCSKCGRSARGRDYRFYFGRPVDRKIARGDLLVVKTTTTTTTYQIDGSKTLFVCSRCVRRSNRLRDLALTAIGLFLGVVLLGVAFGKSWWNPGLLYFAVGAVALLVGIGGLMSLFSDSVGVDDGEVLAVKLARKRGSHDAETYWTATQYEKLKKKQR